MELSNLEVAAVEQAISNAAEHQIENLTDLQLALVGGGIGEVILG